MEVNSGQLKTKPVNSKVEGLKRESSDFVKNFFFLFFSVLHFFFLLYIFLDLPEHNQCSTQTLELQLILLNPRGVDLLFIFIKPLKLTIGETGQPVQWISIVFEWRTFKVRPGKLITFADRYHLQWSIQIIPAGKLRDAPAHHYM